MGCTVGGGVFHAWATGVLGALEDCLELPARLPSLVALSGLFVAHERRVGNRAFQLWRPIGKAFDVSHH